MPLTYTTVQAIASRLRSRLAVGGIGAPFGPGVVEDGLIERIGLQVEARVNARLGTRYVLPLTTPQPLISSAVEKLILCELLAIHSLDDEQAISTESGADRSYTGLMCRQGADELEAIANGTTPLPGEVLITDELPLPALNVSATRLRAPLTDPARDIGNIIF